MSHGHDDVFREMVLGLAQDSPAVGATVPQLRTREQRDADRRRADRVGNGWSRADVQLALYVLAHHVLRHRYEVVVDCLPPRGHCHDGRVTWRKQLGSHSWREQGARQVAESEENASLRGGLIEDRAKRCTEGGKSWVTVCQRMSSETEE